MQEKTAEQIKEAEWADQLKRELEKRTGREDIELSVSPLSYRATLVVSPDGCPVVAFNVALQENPAEIASALDYVSEMLQDWEVTKVIHKKAEGDCQPFFERVKAKFPNIVLNYNIIDSGKHCIWVAKKDGKTLGHFDLWPTMSPDDVKRIITCIGDLEDTLNREDATYAEMSYWWQ